MDQYNANKKYLNKIKSKFKIFISYNNNKYKWDNTHYALIINLLVYGQVVFNSNITACRLYQTIYFCLLVSPFNKQ